MCYSVTLCQTVKKKIIKKLAKKKKSFQEIVKKEKKVVRKLSKSFQKVVKKLQKSCQKVLSKPSADSFAVGRRQKSPWQLILCNSQIIEMFLPRIVIARNKHLQNGQLVA
jgi:hypothetical protein